MTRFRTFRNSDPPNLARLWNLAVPRVGTAHPLRVHELDVHAWGNPTFDPAGLIIAERQGQAIGFAHAGFGPDWPLDAGRPFQLNREIGTVAMLLVDPAVEQSELPLDLLAAAEDYLRSHGAQVLYAGGVFPLNPFYWGLYGGSEGAAILSSHTAFHRAVAARGYDPVATTVLLELDLVRPDPRDPRTPLIRRQTQVEYTDDAPPADWWQNLALGESPLTQARLIARAGGGELARASTWEMRWFGREEGRIRNGLVGLAVPPEHRRKGYARFLLSEIIRTARSNMIDCIAVQTSAENQPALALYGSLGFEPTDRATLYRARQPAEKPQDFLQKDGLPLIHSRSD